MTGPGDMDGTVDLGDRRDIAPLLFVPSLVSASTCRIALAGSRLPLLGVSSLGVSPSSVKTYASSELPATGTYLPSSSILNRWPISNRPLPSINELRLISWNLDSPFSWDTLRAVARYCAGERKEGDMERRRRSSR